MKFRNGIDFKDLAVNAAKKRVAEDAVSEVTDAELTRAAQNLLSLGLSARVPGLRPNDMLSSVQQNTYLKDNKYILNMLLTALNRLDASIDAFDDESLTILSDIEQESISLLASFREEQLKRKDKATRVHFNKWARPKDMSVGWSDPNWKTDYKSRMPFLIQNESNIIHNFGLTLPVQTREQVNIRSVQMINEESDSGDTIRPLVYSDPNNLIHENKTFQNVLVKEEFTKRNQRRKNSGASCSLLIELNGTQLVNMIELDSASVTQFEISKVAYLNESQEEVELLNKSFSNFGRITLFMEPIRTKYIKICYEQKTPIAKQTVNSSQRVEQINDLLANAGMSVRLNSNSEEIQGDVYDLSLENIRAYSLSYSTPGLMRSKPVELTSPVGFSIDYVSSEIHESEPSGEMESFQEFYLGLTLRTENGTQIFRDLLPVVDTYPLQKEELVSYGNKYRIKLFPDFRWTILNRHKVESAEPVTGSITRLTTTRPHGLSSESSLAAVSKEDHEFNGEFDIVGIPSPTTVDIAAGGLSFNPQDHLNAFFFIPEDCDAPVKVYENNQLLQLGVDYEISIDGGSTWLNKWPMGGEHSSAYNKARSGTAYLRFKNNNLSSSKFIEYKPLENQFLGNTSYVRLHNSRVILDKSLRDSNGEVQTVIITRSRNQNIYVSPVLLEYTLKVIEHVP